MSETTMEDGIIIDPNQPTEAAPETAPVVPEVTEPEIDYKTKFSESSKEALRLLEESKAKDAEIERLRKLAEDKGTSYSDDPEFADYPEEERERLVSFAKSIEKKAVENLYKDPAIARAKESYNESEWNNAFESVASQYPELKDNKDDFKAKYYKPGNVPPNIKDLLGDIAKIYLFDKAKDIGAKEAIDQQNRIELERSNGGDKTPPASRTLEDWTKLAASNPAEFARRSKEYYADL
jgi:hypothetical protein